MMMPGMINLDFADVRTVMKEMGRAMMGTGEAEGDRRALDAAEAAIANPLLEETSMRGAKGVLINITGGNDITLFEVDEAANRIRDEVESDAHIIFGSCFDESMEGKIRVSVVATGIESEAGAQPRPMPTRPEPTRPTGRRLPEIRTAAPTTRSPVTAHAAAPATAPAAQSSFGGFGFGGPTLAPATGTMDLQAEEKALMEMAAAVRAEIDHAPTTAAVAEVEAAPTSAQMAPAPAYMAPAPVAASAPVAAQAPQMSAQTAAVAEAVARAPAAAPARTAPTVSPFAGITARETFIPRAPVEPRMERAEPREVAMDNRYEPAAPVMGGPAPAAAPAPAAKAEPGRIRLFDRYRSLTAKPKVEDAAPAPQPQANVQRPMSGGGLNISMSPADRPVASHSEDELEIPAFLRRQAN
jgi:cell division protein FtsZ